MNKKVSIKDSEKQSIISSNSNQKRNFQKPPIQQASVLKYKGANQNNNTF